MIQFQNSVSYNDLGRVEPRALLDMVKAHCMTGTAMHQTSLMSIVLKLTYLTRDLSLTQPERDEAATFATSLANAAINSYGKQSEFSREMISGVNAIVGQFAAA